jgi:hypothetical protein
MWLIIFEKSLIFHLCVLNNRSRQPLLCFLFNIDSKNVCWPSFLNEIIIQETKKDPIPPKKIFCYNQQLVEPL